MFERDGLRRTQGAATYPHWHSIDCERLYDLSALTMSDSDLDDAELIDFLRVLYVYLSV